MREKKDGTIVREQRLRGGEREREGRREISQWR